MTTMLTGSDAAAAASVNERLFGAGIGAFHLLCVHLGHELGLYQLLADDGCQTAAQLAARAGLDAWYVREWLQEERAAGLVVLDGDDIDTGEFGLAPGVAAAIVDETSPYNVVGLAGALAAVGSVTPRLVDAFRTGEGVPYEAYGPGAVSAQAALNRPAYANSLVDEWLPAIPDLHQRLRDVQRPARIADVGCGTGWAAIELALAFPHLRITGFDSDDESIARARRNAAIHAVDDRVDFEVRDITRGQAWTAHFDLVVFFECLHDLAHPVEALTAARRSLVPGGSVLVMDERIEDELAPPGDPLESFFAAVSVLWCLPQGRVERDSTAIGTVMRPSVLDRVARDAGFAGSDRLQIDHPLFRFYLLTP